MSIFILFDSLLASMFIGLFCGLIGAICYLRKESLRAEALSHACYPGLMCLLFVFNMFKVKFSLYSLLLLQMGSGLIGMLIMHFWSVTLIKSDRDRDTMLCWSIASSMGLAMLFISMFQKNAPHLYIQAQHLIYGQMATVVSTHVYLLAFYTAVTFMFVCCFFRAIQVWLFDGALYPFNLSKEVSICERFFRVISSLAIVSGLQSGGVALVTALMVSPAVSARAISSRLSDMLVLSPLLGALYGLFGTASTFYINSHFAVSVPPGSMVAIISVISTLLILALWWPNGFVFRFCRSLIYRSVVTSEHILKSLLHCDCQTINQISARLDVGFMNLVLVISYMYLSKYVCFCRGRIKLTEVGRIAAGRVVNFYNLLRSCMIKVYGLDAKLVNNFADEMEHLQLGSGNKFVEFLFDVKNKEERDS